MPESDPDQSSIVTVPASATAPVRPIEPAEPPPTSNGSTAAPPDGPAPRPASGPPPRSRTITPVGSRFVVLHPHVSFFGWLADKQGPADATPEERLDRYRRDSPWLFRTCVVLDLLVLFVVTGILVAALGAVLFKAIFGVV
jgi:hypothetical protein